MCINSVVTKRFQSVQFLILSTIIVVEHIKLHVFMCLNLENNVRYVRAVY